MKVIVSRYSGVCFGVQRALKLAEEALLDHIGRKIYTWGPLIHNPHVVKDLAEKGISSTEVMEDVCDGDIVIVRSHGIAKELEDELRARGATVIDATCPFVKNAQKKAQYLYQNGYEVFIFGEHDHPEVQAILSYTDYKGTVVAHADDAKFQTKKVGIVSQTTRNKEPFSALCAKASAQVTEVLLFNTICDATHLRQSDALSLADTVEFMIVVGGKNSANTRKLFELVSKKVPSVHIESEKELDSLELMRYNAVGITAGASTPDFIIQNVTTFLKKIHMGGNTV